ncbi:Fic family protein [Pseudomonas sp. NPDC090233]|uniref:Fic family protein n=1 Tax=Pseudomonas sp. NPDC090233 TaxID=3364479 RepID=UPI00383AC051
MSNYEPPLTVTPRMLALVAEISEYVGQLTAYRDDTLTPQLRRGNRIRTIQASLAIENNTLSVEQVTALLEGKRVLGLPREIQEVRNAFSAYDAMPTWQPDRQTDLLTAHRLLMQGLIDDAGHFRQSGVGIYRGAKLLHMAPPASRVPTLVHDLLEWLARSEWHPLIVSCVFHYEFEFIHPFADGNGRMGRLWQTLLLSRWRAVMAFMPVETVIREQQDAYYAALAAADKAAEATPFAEFMLGALLQALIEAIASDQVTDQVTDQVASLLSILPPGVAFKTSELMQRLGLSHRPTFSKSYLKPALAAGLIEMTEPASPRSPTQQYRRVLN